MSRLFQADFARLIAGQRQKPLGAVRIDASHPHSQGLFDCVLFNEGGGLPFNLAYPVPLVFQGALPTWATTAEGPAYYTTGTQRFDINDHGNIAAADCTIRVLFVPISFASDFTPLFDNVGNELQVYINASGQLRYVGIGNTTRARPNGAFDNPTAKTFALNAVNDFVLTRTGTAVSAYIDGIQVFTDTLAGVTGSANPIYFGQNSTDNQHLLVQTWLRGMSAAEVRGLYFDPYGMFMPAEGEMPALIVPPAIPQTFSIDPSIAVRLRQSEMVGYD